MKRTILYLSLAIIAFSSCNKQKTTQKFLPHVIGGMNDVIVIMSTSNWESDAGDLMRKELQQQVLAIPQDEQILDIIWMPHEVFDKAIKKQRNIIITKIGPDYQPKIQYHKSLWAHSQIVIQIMAPNEDAFIELFEKNAKNIIAQIQEAELERLMSSYRKSPESAIIKKLNEEYNITLTVPKGYTVNLEDDNFIWLDNRHRNVIEGLLIYSYPYTDSNTFSQDFLVKKRNAILKRYVPGETRGSFPQTETRFPILVNEYELNGKRYTFEMRGLWHVIEGMAMGGSFVSITQYDEVRKRIVTVDGFLFAPGEEKRNLIKRLDAVLYSLDFPSDKVE